MLKNFWKRSLQERSIRHLATCLLVLIFFFYPVSSVSALPQGQEVVSGDAQVQTDGNTMNVTTSNHSIIQWQSFNVASNETVNFILPSTDSFTLNRVIGSGSSTIAGMLTANGNLILVNQNGFYIPSSGNINAGGFMISTHDISNQNFLGGQYIFSGLDHQGQAAAGAILNEGQMTATNAKGMAILVADAVENKGTITAPLGTVSLAAGKMVTVSISQDGFISIGIDQPTAQQILDKDGNPITDQIKNSGTVKGAKVTMDAKAMDSVFTNAINMDGIVDAGNVVTDPGSGKIRIMADGNIQVGGTLTAPAEGGEITVHSDKSIQIAANTATTGPTTFEAASDIKVNADITTTSGDLTFKADVDLDGAGAFLQAAGTLIQTVTSGSIKIYASGVSTLANMTSAAHLYLNQAGAAVNYTQQAGSKIITAGSLFIGPGVTLTAADTVYQIGKDWVNQGSFIAQLSLVKLVGSQLAQVIGSNTFFNFEVSEFEKLVQFDAGQTQDIVGTLTLQGGFGKLLILRSTIAGIPWKINPTGTVNLSYLDIMDSSNINIHGPPLAASYSKNSLNNTFWDFSQSGPVWTNSGNSSVWSDPLNWDGGFVPGAGDIVRFNSASISDSIVDSNFSGAIAGLLFESGYTGAVTLQRDLSVSGNVILNSGFLKADSKSLTAGGGITIGANAAVFAAGTVTLQAADILLLYGTIDGTNLAPGGVGATVRLLGDHVGLMAGSSVNVSGNAGGGTVLIGGDYLGGGETPRAKATIVQTGASIQANALTSGNGGRVIVWSDEYTNFAGAIEAKALGETGDGGFVETSSKINLQASGTVDASSKNGKPGTWLLDPADVTISTGADANVSGNPNFVPTAASAVINTTTIQTALNAGTSVTITTSNDGFAGNGDITVSNTITKSSGGDATLTLSAYRNIIISAAISSSSGKLHIVLRADNAGNSSGYVNIAAAITTNGGDLTIGGGSGAISAGAGYAVGNAGQVTGVLINNVNVNAGGGNIIVNGKGFNTTTDNNYGVRVTGASGILQTSGSGTVTVYGTGQGNTNSATDYGVYLSSGGVIASVDGNLAINGTGGGAGSGTFNFGVYVTGSNSTIKTTGLGNLSVTGMGGNPSGSGGANYGIMVESTNGIQTTGTGNITISGTGGNGSGTGSSNAGLYLNSTGTITACINCNITINATGGNSSNGTDYGVYVHGNGTSGSAAITATGTGTINLTANASGTGGNNYGLIMDAGGIISTVNGNLTINATGGGSGTGSDNYGVYINGANVQTTGSANISITGTGGNSTGSGGNNYGVNCVSANCIQTTGTGDISVTGTGGNDSGSGTSNNGVFVNGGTINACLNCNITITGTSGNSSGGSSRGIIIGGTVATTGSGTITLTGTGRGSASSSNNYGILITGTVSTENGNLTISNTTGGTGTGSQNYGLEITNANATIKTTGSGNISITATGGGGSGSGIQNYGVYCNTANCIQTTGTGNITITGTGGNGSGSGASQYGVEVQSGSITTVSGNITITGYGGNSSANANEGIDVNTSSTISTGGAGILTLSGTGGGSVNSGLNYGIGVVSGSVISSVNGDLIINNTTGGGAGSGASNYGLIVTGTNSTIKTTGSGNISITATGGNASGSGASNYGVSCTTTNCIQTTGTGNITISGTGGNSSGDFNMGVIVSDASITSSGTGNITITGTGNGNTNSGSDYGVYVVGSASDGVISSINGTITITGNGSASGAGVNGYGVRITVNNSTVKTTGSGSISITGNGGSTGTGFLCQTTDCVQAVGTGTISLTGTANGASLPIDLQTFSGGPPNITNIGSGITFNSAVRVLNDSIIGSATSTGSITFAGTVNGFAGSSALTLRTSGAILFQGAVGGTGVFSTLTLYGGASSITFTQANTFSGLTIYAPNTVIFPSGKTQTITGLFIFEGSSGNVINIHSSSGGSQATLSKSSGVAAGDWLSLQDINAAGGASWFGGANSTNVSGNTGWTFTTNVNRYWVGGGSSTNWSATGNTNWSYTSGGAGNAPAPDASTHVYFDGNSGSGNSTISASISILSLDMTGYTGTLTHNSAITLTITGNTFKLAAGMTYTLGSATTSAISLTSLTGTAASPTAITTAGKTLGNVTLNGLGGYFTLQDDMTLGSSTTLTFTAGTFDANGKNITMGIFNSNNTNTRTLTMGSGIWTLTGSNSTIWAVRGTGLTLNIGNPIVANYSGSVGTREIDAVSTAAEATSFSFNITAGSDTIQATNQTGGGGAFKDLNFTGFTGAWTLAGATTTTIFGNLTLSAGMTITSSNLTVTFAASSGTKTITSNGKTMDFPLIFGSGSETATWQLQDDMTVGSTRTVTFNNGTIDFNSHTLTTGLFSTSNSNVRALNGPGTLALTSTGTVWSSGTPTNLTFGGSSKITIKTTDSSATNKTISAGLASNFASIWISAGTSTITFTNVTNVTDLDFTGFSGTGPAFPLTINGSLTLSATMTMPSASASAITFAATSGTKTITSAGKTIDQPLTFNGAGGTWQLQDDLTMGSTRTLTLTNGTFDANGKNISTGLFALGSGTKTLTMGSGTWTLTGSGNVWNTSTNNTGLTLNSNTSTLAFTGGSAQNITAGGKTFNNLTVNKTAGIALTLNDAWALSGTLTVTQGTLTANNQNVTAAAVSSSNTNTRTITMGSGTWTLTGTGTVWDTSTTTNLTFTANTHTIAITDTSATGKTFAGGGLTFNNLTITGGGTGAVTFTGSNTFANFTIGAPKTVTFTAGTTTTFTGTFTAIGSAGNVITINSSSGGSAATLSKSSGIVSGNYLSIQDSTAAGGATWSAGPNSTSVSGNSGWDFTVSYRTIADGGGNWDSTSTWVEGIVPTASDNVIATATSGNLTINVNASARSIDLTNYAGTVTHNAGVTLSIGDSVSGAGNTALLFPAAGWTYTLGNAATSAISFVSTSTVPQNVNFGGKTAGNVTFNGSSGSWKLTGDLNLGNTATLTLTAGTFDANGYNVTIGLFSSSNSNARTLTMGNGTWTLTGNNGTIWTTVTTTNLAFNRGNAIIANYSGSTGTRVISADTFSALEAISLDFNITAGTDHVSFSAGSSIRNLDFTGFSGTLDNTAFIIYGNLTVSSGMTLQAGTSTISLKATSGIKAITSNGKTFDFPLAINGVGGTFQLADDLTLGSTRTLTVTAGTFDANGHNVTAGLFSSSNSNTRTITMGAGTWTITGNNGTVWDTSTTTNLTFNRGNAIVFNYSGGTGTRTISTGSLAEANAPSLNVTAGTDTLVITTNVYNLDFTTNGVSGFAGTLIASTRTVYGNLTISNGMTLSAGASVTTLGATSGTKTITSNGKTMDFPLTFNGVGGTWQLADNLTLGSSRTLTVTNGTFDANGKDVSIGFFALGSGTKTVTMGSGQWTMTSGSGVLWDTSTNASGLTFNRGTNPVLFNGSNLGITFTMGSLSESSAPSLKITSFVVASVAITGNVFNLDFTSNGVSGFSGSLSNGARTIYGNLTLSNSMTISAGGSATTFAATSGTKTITSNGITMDFPLIFNGAGGTWQLADNLTVGSTRTITLTAGTFNANGFNVSTGGFSADGTSTRTLTMGAGTWTLTGNNMTIWSLNTATNLTFNNGSAIVANYSGSTGTRVIYGSTSGTALPDFNITAGTDAIALANGSSIGTVDFTGFSGALRNSTTNIYGSVTFSAGMTIGSGSGVWTFKATSGTKTITSNGKTLDFPVTFNGVGGTWQLADALTLGSTRTLTLTNGTFNANNQNVSTGLFSSSNSNTRTLTMGNGTWTLSGTGTVWDTGTTTNLTFSGSSATIKTTDSSAVNKTISAGSLANFSSIWISAGTSTITFTNVTNVVNLNFTGFSGTGPVFPNTINGSLTLSSGMIMPAGSATAITFAATSGTKTITSAGQTIDRPITFDGVGGTWQLADDLTVGSTRTVTVTNGTFDANNHNVTVGFFASNNANTRTVTMGSGTWTLTGNSGGVWNIWQTFLTFNRGNPIIVNYSGGIGTRSFTVGSLSESSAPSFRITAGTDTISMNNTINDLDFTGFSGTLSNTGFTMYGSLTLSSGMTLSAGANAITFAATSGTKTITSNSKTMDFPVTFNGAGGTWQLADDMTVGSSRTVTLTNGTLDFNNHTLTAGLFSTSNSNNRALSGPGTLALSGTGTIFTSATSTNLSFGGSSKITIKTTDTSSTAKAIDAGSASGFASLWISAGDNYTFTNMTNVTDLNFTGFSGTSPAFPNTIYGSLTLSATMTMPAGSATALTFAATSGTKTITSAGKTIDRPITFDGVGGTWQLADDLTVGSTRTVTVSNGTFDANNHNVTMGVFDSSNNNTRTITMGNGTWTLTGNNTTVWTTVFSTGLTLNRGNDIVLNYSGSVGTRNINTANFANNGSEALSFGFKITGGTDVIDITTGKTIYNLDFTGFAGTFNNTAMKIYGNLTLSSGMTVSGGANAATFAATSGTKTITSNGKTMDFPIIFDGVGGTWQLADALTLGSTRTLTLTNGSFNANGFNVTANTFSSNNSNTRTLTMGSGTWTLTGTGTVWDTSTTTGLTFSGASATIKTTDSSAANKTISAGSLTNFSSIWISAGASTITFTNVTNVVDLIFTGFSGTGPVFPNTINGSLTLSATMTLPAGSATAITFAATSGTKTITSAGQTIDRPITFDGVGGTWQLADALTLGSTRTLTLTNGSFNANGLNVTANTFSSNNSNTRTLTMGNGTWTLSGTGTIWDAGTTTGLTFSANNSTISITDGSAFGKTFSGGGLTYYDLSITGGGSGGVSINGNNSFHNITLNSAGTTVTLGGNTTVSNVLTITAGTLDASTRTLTLSGTTGTPFVNSGSFTASNSTVQYTGNNAGGNTTVAGAAYYNLILNNAAETYSLGGDTTVSSVLTITAGTLDAGSSTLTLSGTTGTPFVNSGSFTASNSTVQYTGNNAGGNTTVTNVTYNHLTLNNALETYVLAGATAVNGNLNITAGTLDVVNGQNYGLTVGGNWSNSGTFTARLGTVTLNGSNQTMNGDTVFYNLTKTAAAADTLTFQDNSTQTIAGTLTLQGAAANELSLRSTSGGVWKINPQGLRTLSFLKVKNSTNLNITSILCLTGCMDETGNTGWIFTTASPAADVSNDTVDPILVIRIIDLLKFNQNSLVSELISSSGISGPSLASSLYEKGVFPAWLQLFIPDFLVNLQQEELKRAA